MTATAWKPRIPSGCAFAHATAWSTTSSSILLRERRASGPGMQILAVNGLRYSADVLRNAIKDSKTASGPHDNRVSE